MAQGMNKAILVGHLGGDPELRFTQSGQALLKLRLATNESWKDKAGERQERTDWHTVVVWGKRAEALNGILSKGRNIGVDGRIRTRSYEAKDGGRRTITEIIADNVVLLGRRPDGGGGSSSAPPSADAGAPDADVEPHDDIPF